MKKIALLLVTGLMASVAFASPLNQEEITSDINWELVPAVKKTLFYPGEVTYAWLNSKEHKGTTKRNFENRSCASCHAGEERGLGENLVKLEPTMTGKRGSVEAAMQFVHDDEYLYIRTQWQAQAGHPGRMHNMIKYDGEKWSRYGGDRMSTPDNPLYEDRLSFMIDDGKVEKFQQQGCFMSCHEGERDLKPASKLQALATSVIGIGGLNKDDIRKFLPESRVDGTSWDKPKSQEEIDRLKAEGQFVDLMQWRSTRSAPTGHADDGYVFEYRMFDEGKNVFAWNLDRKTMKPKYMFDASVTGFYALDRADNEDLSKSIALIEGVNTMPYDASKIKPGQLLQGRVLTKPEGSAGDNNEVSSDFVDGSYTVIFKRKLNTGNPKDDKIMLPGGTYEFNVAIHDDSTTTRSHFVSFPFNLGLGKDARGDVKSIYIKR